MSALSAPPPQGGGCLGSPICLSPGQRAPSNLANPRMQVTQDSWPWHNTCTALVLVLVLTQYWTCALSVLCWNCALVLHGYCLVLHGNFAGTAWYTATEVRMRQHHGLWRPHGARRPTGCGNPMGGKHRMGCNDLIGSGNRKGPNDAIGNGGVDPPKRNNLELLRVVQDPARELSWGNEAEATNIGRENAVRGARLCTRVQNLLQDNAKSCSPKRSQTTACKPTARVRPHSAALDSILSTSG